MSLTMHMYDPDFCDGHFCQKDCEGCPTAEKIMEHEEYLDSLETDEPSDDQLEMGFDPYAGCYTYDC